MVHSCRWWESLRPSPPSPAGADFLEWLGPDTSAVVFALLRDPADIARASAVSRSWRTIVLATHFSKIQCLKLCPEAAHFARVEPVAPAAPDSDGSSATQESAAAGSSSNTAAAWENHRREQHGYTRLAEALLLTPPSTARKDCVDGCVGASSTDNFPEESIVNTLEATAHTLDPMAMDIHAILWDFQPTTYWSSSGQADPAVPECLTYKLCADLCLVDEVKIKPFRAYFQGGAPIYSAQYVRFSFGCPKSPLRPEDLETQENEGKLTGDNNYIWTYTSPEFPMLQVPSSQSFKLPHPVLCIGGVVKVELLGRVQRQAADNLYYICVARVQILGHPLASEFGVAVCGNDLILKYSLDPCETHCSESSGSQSKWHNIEARFWQQVSGERIRLNQELVSRLLGPSVQSLFFLKLVQSLLE